MNFIEIGLNQRRYIELSIRSGRRKMTNEDYLIWLLFTATDKERRIERNLISDKEIDQFIKKYHLPLVKE